MRLSRPSSPTFADYILVAQSRNAKWEDWTMQLKANTVWNELTQLLGYTLLKPSSTNSSHLTNQKMAPDLKCSDLNSPMHNACKTSALSLSFLKFCESIGIEHSCCWWNHQSE